MVKIHHFIEIYKVLTDWTMAEIVGTISACVGIASFAAQVFGSIKILKDAYEYNQKKAPENLDKIIDRLEFLKLVLEKLEPYEGNPIVDRAIRSCQSTFRNVEEALDVLLQKVNRKSPGKMANWKPAKFQLSEKIREQIDEIRSELLWVIMTLNLSSSVCLMPLSPPENGVQNAIDHSTSSSTVDSPVDDKAVHRANINDVSALSYPRSPPITQRTSCTVHHCHCSCHLTNNSLGRYWGFEYTPMSIIFGKCDNKRCDMKNVRWSFRLAFNKLSIKWAFLIDLEVILGAQTYSLRPALSLQRVVNYTSPGFETLWKCKNLYITLSEAQDQLRMLDRSPSPLRHHVNPDGNNYVRELLYHGPWADQNAQFALLSLFVNELGITLENENVKFLTRCASWIGEGHHLDLLYLVLGSGFDSSRIDSPLFQDWPTACSPGWISEEVTPDPFFLKYLAAIAKEDPGFGGSTALQDAVLCGSEAAIDILLSSVDVLENHRNFLGQTPLHLAVSNPQIFTMILNAGHDMDVTDRWGITPLMYAAAMGVGDVVQLLISEGANITARATIYERDFMRYASLRGHWDIILESLSTIQLHYSEEVFQEYVCKAFCHLVSNVTWLDSRAGYFERLAEICADVNFTFEDRIEGTEENNLLHYVMCEKELRALIRRGFHSFNKPNSRGELPLYSIVHRSNIALIQCCLDHETDVNHIDHSGRTVILRLLQCLRVLFSTTWDKIDSIKLCLDRGLDISHGDSCKCACSSKGCNTSSAFDLNIQNEVYRLRPGFIWALEWVWMIEEYRGYEDSKTLILSLIRRTRFDLLGITHVCCHRGKGLGGWESFHSGTKVKDVHEVSDEDQELIELLEEEMQEYSSKHLDALTYEWMTLLRQKYNNKKAAEDQDQKKREASNLTSNYIIDHQKDTYRQIFVPKPVQYQPMYLEMSEYAFWLQHQYLRTFNAENRSLREEWYEKRTRWFSKLLRVMGISKQKVKQEMEVISLEETRSEKIDVKAVIGQFTTSIKAS